MKILFNYFTGGGGGFSNILMLLRAMAVRYPADHIYLVCSPSTDFSTLRDLPNITIAKLGEGKTGELARLKHSAVGLRKLATKFNVDVIWSMNLGAYTKGHIPQVISINNPYQAYPIGVLRYHPAGRVHAFILRLFSRVSVMASQGIVVQTDAMRRQLVDRFGSVKPILIAPKSIENDADVKRTDLPTRVAEQLESGLGPSAFTFLYVATGFLHKNHKVLIDAFVQLRSQGVLARLGLTLDKDEVVAMGGETATHLIDSGYLMPLGWIAKEHVRPLYEACDACLMPSVLESLSSAHLEAMAWGKPQIVADLPYSRELCGDAAVYADPGSPAAWASQINVMISDPVSRSLLSKNGYSRMANFPNTWNGTAEIVRNFLQSVVAEKVDF